MNESFAASLILAQGGSGAPPTPGQAVNAPAPGTTAAPGSGTGTGTGGGTGAGGTPPGAFNNQFIFVIVLMVVLMFVFSIMGQRRDRKKREALINAIKKHDRVQTIGGVIGSVVEVKPEYVILKVDESSNTRITFARSAIQQVLNASAETAAAPEGGDAR